MKNEFFYQYRTYVTVDLAAIRHNGQVAKSLFPKQRILSVLKANAYGHGIVGVLPAYETFTDWYAVATAEEALQVRKFSSKPVLVLGPVPEGLMTACAKHSITFSVGSLEYANRLSEKLMQANLVGFCHLKIDTGLNRSGVRWRDESSAMKTILSIRGLPNLHFTGNYTHLSCAEGKLDWEVEHTVLQMKRFTQACDAMQTAGLDLGILHCCSTGGALVNPAYRLDMVRLGMLPMGMSYTDESVECCDLVPAMKWISFVSQIENVTKDETISYGCTYRAPRDMRIGIVTCGYADGYRRVNSNKSYVLAGGKKVPVIGRVAMDYLVIDLTDVPVCSVGMEVILLGTDGVHQVSAQELSAYGESVSGEITCVISDRVKRIYIDSEEGIELV